MIRRYTMLGAINMFLAVAIGAFGAHGLKGKISADMLDVYQTGVHYHMVHALGLFAVALLVDRLQASKQVRWAGNLLFVGIILFSGSLYLLAITGITILGAITPLGGICFLLGWVFLFYAALKETKK